MTTRMGCSLTDCNRRSVRGSRLAFHAALGAVAVSSAAIVGVPAAMASGEVAGSATRVTVAGQSWSRSSVSEAPAPTDPTLGAAFYAIPAPVAGEHVVRLTLTSREQKPTGVTIERTFVPIPGFAGERLVERAVTVTDGSLEVALAADGSGVVLVAVDVLTPQGGEAGLNDGSWQRLYRNDFSDLGGVNAFQSPADVNSRLRPTDTENSPLQRPSLRSNVEVVPDPKAQDGRALGVFTRVGQYQTATGTARGWTNGRMMIKNQEHAPPLRVRTRLKMTASAHTKSAVMWWPAGGGWPWEVDFVEPFGGSSMTNGWGSRQKISQRWHADLNGDGMAKEQLVKDIPLDATQFHVYDLFVTPERMWIEIDGVLRMETTDRRYIPDRPGFFTIGKAMTGRRDIAGRTEDAVVVDWVEIYGPARI